MSFSSIGGKTVHKNPIMYMYSRIHSRTHSLIKECFGRLDRHKHFDQAKVSALATEQYESASSSNLHTTLPNEGQQCHIRVQKKNHLYIVSLHFD